MSADTLYVVQSETWLISVETSVCASFKINERLVHYHIKKVSQNPSENILFVNDKHLLKKNTFLDIFQNWNFSIKNVEASSDFWH